MYRNEKQLSPFEAEPLISDGPDEATERERESLGRRLGRAWPVRLFGWLFVALMLVWQGSCVRAVIEGLPESPCGESKDLSCLEVNLEAAATYTNENACLDATRQICLVPLGDTSLKTIEGVAAHFRAEYGLLVEILPPLAVDPRLLDADRSQIEAVGVSALVSARYSGLRNPADVLIAITPADIYWADRPNWRYAFSVWGAVPHEGPGKNAIGVVSVFRMDTGGRFPFGLRSAPVDSRLKKMTTRMVGGMYYGLPSSPDPQSAMYGNILSPLDLDRMSDRLDLAAE